jgi:hypothetical protein
MTHLAVQNDITTLLPTEGVKNFRHSVMVLQREHEQLPQVECPLVHYFANGACVREATIPADTIVIGKIHRHETINILLKGEITVVTEHGTMRLKAPCTFVSPPNTKKAAYTHSEVIWSNVFATVCTDIKEIERQMVYDDYEDTAFLDHVTETLRLEDLCHS